MLTVKMNIEKISIAQKKVKKGFFKLKKVNKLLQSDTIVTYRK